MDYEKKYKDALERAKRMLAFYKDPAYEEVYAYAKEDIPFIFPELKESEDERMRAMAIKAVYAPESQSCIRSWGIDPDDVIAWLEKQGKQEYTLKSAKDEDVRKFMQQIKKEAKAYEFNLPNRDYDIYAFAKDILAWLEKQVEEKPIDEVNSKFKVGDWINRDGSIWCIEGVSGKEYILGGRSDVTIQEPIHIIDTEFRLWTIQDAKDSDVLAASDGSIFIFKEIVDCGCKHYIALEKDNKTINVNDNLKHFWESIRGVKPATKEQRELLFKKMKESGYEWNPDKLELKKLEC